MIAVDDTLSALADRTRRGVVELLSQRPHRAGELASALDMSAPAMSRHLRVLRKLGLVEEHSPADDARVRIYRLRKQPFDDLRTWVDDVSAFWNEQLMAFKAHAESLPVDGGESLDGEGS